MKFRGLVIIALFIVCSQVAFAQLGNLSCQIRATSCLPTEVAMMGLTATSNGHAMLPAAPSNHKLCCSGPSNLVFGPGDENFLDLNSFGHVEEITSGVYPLNLEMDADPELECGYQTNAGSSLCSDRYFCMVSIDQSTNAHVGDCSQYDRKVCCRCQEQTEPIGMCGDGIDNDCDGLIDCADSDCFGKVRGYVHGYSEENGTFNLSEATVEGFEGITRLAQATTNISGGYNFTDVCGAVNFVAKKTQFAEQTKTVYIPPGQVTEVNFTKNESLVFAQACESDCTLKTDDFMREYCNNVNGCEFYDDLHAEACDETEYKSYDPNFNPWPRPYGVGGQVIECRPGATPYTPVVSSAVVVCPPGTRAQAVSQSLARVAGKGVKVNVAVCVSE